MPIPSKNSSKGLLILTQKVDLDDEALGFAHGWYSEFSKHFSNVTIICLNEGRHSLPQNVRVLSLGKDRRSSRLTQLVRLMEYSVSERENYDSVFVHMNPIYVLLMGLPWRAMGKMVTLWYAHGNVSPKLRVALLFAHKVFTSTPEGFRIDTSKRIIVGQGIDVGSFSPGEPPGGPFTIATVGRLTDSKGIDTLVRAFSTFTENNSDARFLIAGTPATSEDWVYKKNIVELIGKLNMNGQIELVGSVRNADVADFLRDAHVFVNAGKTGSLDKATLEAMAVGLPVVSSNDAVCALMNDRWPAYCVNHDATQFAKSLGVIANLPVSERIQTGRDMSDMVRSRFGVEGLIRRISEQLHYA